MAVSKRSMLPTEWRPQGIESLEPAAEEVVRSDRNYSVVAGPGAGKTELLAQRAAFLLQTGRCPSPQRILAISFKSDAAKNLGDRVAKRCEPDQALRFDSRTFDAFAKSLLDRFRAALPTVWRPTANYKVVQPGRRDWEEFLAHRAGAPPALGGKAALHGIATNRFEAMVTAEPLPEHPSEPTTIEDWAVLEWWKDCLSARPSRLTFAMIRRLAELVLRVNTALRKALRLTYSHVFMDEFQDTTEVQYDLVKTAFLGAGAVMTAVGDNKQQIMRWAGAVDDIFERFEADFAAERKPLRFNYRSRPELVRIQHTLALALDGASVPAKAKRGVASEGEHCAILEFDSERDEADYLARFIRRGLDEGMSPRDFVLLVRQRANQLEDALTPVFANYDLILRNEARTVQNVAIQDLMTEPLVDFVMSFLKLGAAETAPTHWNRCLSLLSPLRGIDASEADRYRELQEELAAFHEKLRRQMGARPRDCHLAATVRAVVDFAPADAIRSSVPQYRQGDWFANVLSGLTRFAEECARNAPGWQDLFETFDGIHHVPLMTIHKSKGLEYHTVLFVGLDDAAYWSMDRDPQEGLATFFVAFSRARDRAFFTYCPARAGRDKVEIIYRLLQTAGVPSRQE